MKLGDLLAALSASAISLVLVPSCGSPSSGADSVVVLRERQTFEAASCPTEGPERIAYTELVEERADADLGDDGTVDVMRDGSSMLFRSEAFPELDAPAPWIEVVIPPQDRDVTVPTSFDFFDGSLLGGASNVVRFGPTDWWELATSYEQEGARSPQDALDGVGDPVGSIEWTTDGERGMVTSIEVVRDRPIFPGGMVRLSGSAAPGPWPETPTPSSSDVVAFEDLSALAVLETSTAWSGPCRDGVGVVYSEAALECARQEAGSRTVAQLVAAHPDGSWAMPTACLGR